MNRRGFALIAALWLVVMMSALALEISIVARDRRLSAANSSEGARARAAAVSGLEEARARLEAEIVRSRQLSPGADPAFAADPWGAAPMLMRDSIRVGGAWARVSLRDADALLNVNRASENDLRMFLNALRVDAGVADHLAQSIADWRDADDFRRANGAEKAEYLKAGAPMLPRNGALTDLGELQYVSGMTDAIYAAARPYLTLTGSGQVSINHADRPVLLTLPGFGEEAVAVVLRARASRRRIASLDEIGLQLSAGAKKAFVDEAPLLLARITFETRALEAVSSASVEGSPATAFASAMFVRGGGTAFLIGRRVTP
jgi:type II secretory pathway component PulK